MAIIEELTDEEKYLTCILRDPSGLDLAEFTWIDEEQPDTCWRAWPYQWKWFRSISRKQIDACARAVGKSLSIKMRAYSFPHQHPGQEMLITAPEGNHLNAITTLIEGLYLSTALGREMITKNRKQGGITHRPFEMTFANGAQIRGRIPQRDGKGVKGSHPLWLEMDEAQDYPEAGWKELIETLKRGSKDSIWRAHGVTRGVRDEFYKFSQPENGWTIWRLTAMHRPSWDDVERQEKIIEYGARDAPDYRRNILGLHGDEVNPLFVLHRFMMCVDDDLTSDYNTNEYQSIQIVGEDLNRWDIEDLIQFHGKMKDYDIKWCGMDVGFTDAPSEILIFGETRISKILSKRKPKDEDHAVLKLLMRINMKRVTAPDQARAMLHIMKTLKPKVFAMDKTGVGLPLFQTVQAESETAANIIRGYNFASNILVDFDSTIEIDEFKGDIIKDAGINRNVLEYSSDKLRELVDRQQIWLPWERELIGQFEGSKWTPNKAGQDPYNRKRQYSKGNDHALDATRMAVLGYLQFSIEEFVKKDTQVPVIPIFIG